MKASLKKILSLTVLLFYIVSALEINAYGIENTFFDAFDTYIESKELGLFSSVEIEESKSSIYHHTQFNFKNLFSTEDLYIQEKVCLNHSKPPNNHKENRLYVLYSVWII